MGGWGELYPVFVVGFLEFNFAKPSSTRQFRNFYRAKILKKRKHSGLSKEKHLAMLNSFRMPCRQQIYGKKYIFLRPHHFYNIILKKDNGFILNVIALLQSWFLNTHRTESVYGFHIDSVCIHDYLSL